MGRYTNRLVKYTFLLVVIVASIAFFRVHLNDKLTNTILDVSHIVYGDLLSDNTGAVSGIDQGNTPTPTITLAGPTYYMDDTTVTANEAYSNKLTRVRFDLGTTSLDKIEDVKYEVKLSNTDMTKYFNISTAKRINGSGNYYLYLDLKGHISYASGSYQVKVWIDGYDSGAKTKNFTLLGKYYNATLDNQYGTCWREGSCKTTVDSYFDFVFSNVEGIEANEGTNHFTIEEVKYNGRVNNTYKSKFNIEHTWGSENLDYAQVQIHTSKPNITGYWWNRKSDELPAGTYEITLKYSNPSYSNARGDLYFTAYIIFSANELKLINVDSSSNRLTRYPSSYDFIRYHDNTVTIKYSNEENARNINVWEFITNYSGVNIWEEHYDPDGYYLYSFGPNLYIKNISTEDGNQYVSYYTDPNPTTTSTLTKVLKTDFENNYGVINVNTYKFVDGHAVKIVDGYYREYDTVNKSIRSAGGGRFRLQYSYSDEDSDIEYYFDNATVTITQRPEGADDYTNQVYKRYLVTNGNNYSIKEDKDDAFSFTWEIDTDHNLITVNIVYDDIKDEYTGNYKIEYAFGNYLPVAKYFKIDNAPEDFFLATSVEKHEDSGDPLAGLFPPGNKRYEYYLSLRMLKGEIDPYTKYEAEGIQTAGAIKIFTKRADKDDDGNTYFYDQTDYTIIIDKYNATTNEVTYRYSEDEAESYNLKNYTTITEVVNDSSLLKTKYKDAYKMLTKYKYDANGNIDRTSDNIPNSILKIETVNKIDYLTYITSGTATARIEKEKYISKTNQQDTLVDSYQILDFDIDGNVNRGVINGSFVSQTYPYDDSYDVTDQFDIDVKTEQKYTIILDSYKDNTITYRYSEDEDENYNDKDYETITETLNGSSLFETKYKDANKLLNKYVFNSNGSINRNTDNYNYSIVRMFTEYGTEKITYRYNNRNYTVTKDQYLSRFNGDKTYDIAIASLDFDRNGNINRGVIHGEYPATDIDHAVKILPKTEVEPVDYYVYVNYSPDRYGIGYLNNGISDGVYDPDEVVITPSKYPENWNRNIHMSSIRYIAPEYDVSLDVPRYSNDISKQHRMYYNVDSTVTYEITPKYIYDYDNITYKVQYTADDISTDLTNAQINALNWVDADPNYYNISFGTIDDQEVVTPIGRMNYNPNFDGQYVIIIDTKEGITPGHYRIVVEYTNPDNGISLIRDVFQVFDLTNKYYGLVPVDEEHYPSFIHNYSDTKTISAIGTYITNPSNIALKLYYIQDGVRRYLTKEGNDFKLDGNKFFNYHVNISTNEEDTTGNSIVYSVDLTNYTNAPDITYIGTYGLEISYTEPGSEPAEIDIPFEVGADEYKVVIKDGEEAHATTDELSFTKQIETQYLTEDEISSIAFKLLYYNESYSNYIDVYNTSDSNKHLKRYEFSNINCNYEEAGKCTANVTFILNKNNVDMTGDYYGEFNYYGLNGEFELTKFQDMFGWDIESSSIKSTFNNYHGTNTAREFDGFFKNSDSVKITGVINNRIHDYNVNYSVSQSCIKDSNGKYTTCNPTSNQYGDFFDVNQYGEGNYRYIVLSPKKNEDGSYKIQPGRYQLILYYESTYFRVIEFDVHSVFASIQHSNVSIKSQYKDEEVNGLYKSLNGQVSIDVEVEGVDYSEVERFILDNRGYKVNSFILNSVNEFADNHKTIITYSPSVATVNPGTYYYVTRYNSPDDDVIEQTTEFEVYGEYFDFDIYDISVNPTPLIVNTSGSITYHLSSKNIPYFLRDQYGDASGGNIYKFASNAKMYDYQGNDVTNKFLFSIVTTPETSTNGDFYLVATFKGNTLSVGSYKLETFFSYNGKTVSKYYWVVIDEADRYLEIGDVSIVSNTPDKVVHNSHGGSYIINYVANTEGSENEIDVQVTSSTTNVTNKFGINIANNQINVTYTPLEDNLPEGDYNINITYGGQVEVVQVHLYGEYDPDNPIVTVLPIESNNYDVIKDGDDNIIYVKSLSTMQLRKTIFLSNLNNVHQGYKILNKDGQDVTNSASVVGTNFKLVNPEDATYTIVVVGDVNQDGKISLADVGYIFQYVTNNVTITDKFQLRAAKVRKQDAITLADVGKLFQFATGVLSSI